MSVEAILRELGVARHRLFTFNDKWHAAGKPESGEIASALYKARAEYYDALAVTMKVADALAKETPP